MLIDAAHARYASTRGGGGRVRQFWRRGDWAPKMTGGPFSGHRILIVLSACVSLFPTNFRKYFLRGRDLFCDFAKIDSVRFEVIKLCY